MERLRSQANDLRQGALYSPSEDPSWDATTEAADAIEELTVERDASRLIISDLTAEVERLRVERDDHKQRLAIEAVTAPDADYDTMMDSLQARLRDLHAEVERLNAKVESLTLAGDALAVRHRKTFGLDGAFDTELRQWEAARRG